MLQPVRKGLPVLQRKSTWSNVGLHDNGYLQIERVEKRSSNFTQIRMEWTREKDKEKGKRTVNERLERICIINQN